MEPTRERVLANLESVRERISAACERCGRDPATVRLVAIGKGVEPHVISWIREAGVADLGENYVRELRLKRELIAGGRWHFVGTLQRGSAHHVAELADVVHTVVPGSAFARLQRGALARNPAAIVHATLRSRRRAEGAPRRRIRDRARLSARG